MSAVRELDLAQVNARWGRDASALVEWAVGLGQPTIVTSSRLKFEGHIATAVALPETIQRRVIRQFWQLRRDQRFTQARWDDAKARALRDLNAERYLAGHIAQSEALLDADKNQAQLQLTLDSGLKATPTPSPACCKRNSV